MVLGEVGETVVGGGGVVGADYARGVYLGMGSVGWMEVLLLLRDGLWFLVACAVSDLG